MSQPLHIFKLLQTTAIFFVAALYCLAPLQQPLVDGFHKLEHTILNTNSGHSHNIAHHINVSHGHEHKMLSFLNDLFSDNAQGTEQPVKEFELDKHVLQQYAFESSRVQIIIEKNFHYIFGAYSVSLPFTLPPPEGDFS